MQKGKKGERGEEERDQAKRGGPEHGEQDMRRGRRKYINTKGEKVKSEGER
jgi:hypothetical protein